MLNAVELKMDPMLSQRGREWIPESYESSIPLSEHAVTDRKRDTNIWSNPVYQQGMNCFDLKQFTKGFVHLISPVSPTSWLIAAGYIISLINLANVGQMLGNDV